MLRIHGDRNSLLAARLIERIARQFQLELSLKDFFNAATVALQGQLRQGGARVDGARVDGAQVLLPAGRPQRRLDERRQARQQFAPVGRGRTQHQARGGGG